jgi:biopolymer transport protein ExbD
MQQESGPNWVLVGVLLALLAIAVVRATVAAQTRSTVTVPDATPGPTPVSIERRGQSIIRWDPKDLTLTVADYAPRELLVCLRGECKLVEQWVEGHR